MESDLLAVKNKNRRFCPIYFQKEDIDKELAKVSRVSRGVPYNITAGSLEDVLRKMEVQLRSVAKVVPITLEQVYMLKVEGIAFRFLPDPFQIKNTLESDLLVVKNKNMRFCPIYFQKEEIDKELAKVSRASRGVLRNIMQVGSLEDVLRKMEVQLWRKEQRSAAKLVPITFEQVSMLKVEGIAFRFLPDPVQIKKS
ncbi:unnamed protein product [Linum tenue]|uniref:Uncharacterized protein n=1 Tax=Linum tenue TaxID=586396 RepID=A0AAV0RKK0_9ROSI|nr:unnamed protein product [Linum tenue]CAI0558326.1 unnamed protein product [Linum tenue]